MRFQNMVSDFDGNCREHLSRMEKLAMLDGIHHGLTGPAYLSQMGDAIEQAQALVLMISQQSVGSNQVTTEVVRGP